MHLTACEKKRQKTSSSLLLFLVKAVCEKFAKKAKLLLTWLPIFLLLLQKVADTYFSLKDLDSTSYVFLWFLDITCCNYFWILKWHEFASSKIEKTLYVKFLFVLDTEFKSNQCTDMWIDPTSSERFPPKKETVTNLTYFPFLSFVLLLFCCCCKLQKFHTINHHD